MPVACVWTALYKHQVPNFPLLPIPIEPKPKTRFAFTTRGPHTLGLSHNSFSIPRSPNPNELPSPLPPAPSPHPLLPGPQPPAPGPLLTHWDPSPLCRWPPAADTRGGQLNHCSPESARVGNHCSWIHLATTQGQKRGVMGGRGRQSSHHPPPV